MKKKHDNRGFTLIELIVAIAILAVAGAAVFGFAVNASNSYSRSNKEIKLQYEQQLAVNQIRDMIIESDKGIYYDAVSQSLALYGAVKTSEDSQKTYPVTVICFEDTKGEIYFGGKEFTDPSAVTFADVETTKLLSENVTAFNVDLSGVSKDKVVFEITFMVGEKEQTVKETVALRNRLVASNEVDTIWGEDAIVKSSYIKGINIYRGSKRFSTGDSDTIGKTDGESVLVQYHAVVTATEESTREYAVSWSLQNAPEGVSVSSDGMVTVTKSVPSSTSFKLKATSVDDPTKSTYIVITVDDSGVYPESATLTCGEPVKGNGYYTYKLVATLYYSDGSFEKDCTLFSFLGLDSLPTGCSFDEETGELILSSNANGYTFTIQAKANERDAQGKVVLSNECIIAPTDIPEYVVGPAIRIVTSSKLSRGGSVYPTVVFDNASSSEYVYKWEITPYLDEESAEWDSDLDNSDFNLVSLSAYNSGYSSWNVNHTLTSRTGVRSVVLNCSDRINWSKTFKILISVTATSNTDSETVLAAESKVVTIEPVSFTIEIADPEDIAGSSWGWDNGMDVLTDTTLAYEDWYYNWEKAGKEPNQEENYKNNYKTARRWFLLGVENLYMTGYNLTGNYNLQTNYMFKDQAGTLIYGVPTPTDRGALTYMLYGFTANLGSWKTSTDSYYQQMFDTPSYMSYYLTLKDNAGNSVKSNVQDFSIVYDYYEPTAE